MNKKTSKLEILAVFLYIVWFYTWLGYYVGNKKDNFYIGILFGIGVGILFCITLWFTLFR
jgi:cyanate permease